MLQGRWRVPMLFALAFAPALGCGPAYRLGEVEGVVTLNGKPLPHLRVQFMPDPEKGTQGPFSTSTTDDNGRYRLICADSRPGAVVGWNRVVVTDMTVRLFRTPRHGSPQDDGKDAAPKGKIVQSRVADRYTTSQPSNPLNVEVRPEKQELEIDLTKGTV